ncbi:Lrp/AsnC family transcriptional regulator [Psychrosphaera sp. 1_MG-2023]|uniref:Lrp/AsnC family transcriptional regulator n=1 Tax=Psychrosphaera sp. 1_MG-2023 TaxID=3062643 RepID=UPI0026E40C1F|nr:Lrp/AsnC family transcriptional regulator [Psychrosphaera sp. 1_MG-2023]MDO6720613.1 Lrp/AsnC family transcriptional regulator [Psychrosphaera sp. 1_MG-2023]
MKESTKPNLDKIDKKILKLLQQDGRISNADLADKVNVSAATCYRRTQRLIDLKIIQSVRAQIAPEAIELSALVMVGVVLDRSTPESFSNFETAIKKLSIVLSCYLVAGEFDYLLKIRAKDMTDFNKLHSDKLLALPEVRQLRTYFVMKEVIENAPMPL